MDALNYDAGRSGNVWPAGGGGGEVELEGLIWFTIPGRLAIKTRMLNSWVGRLCSTIHPGAPLDNHECHNGRVGLLIQRFRAAQFVWRAEDVTR